MSTGTFLAHLSAREVILQTADMLEKQGRLSVNGGSCKYRSRTGARCAAGFWIPDDKYEPVMDGSGGWCAIIHGWPEFSGPHNQLIAEMQRCHDSLASANDVQMAVAAIRFLLEKYDTEEANGGTTA